MAVPLLTKKIVKKRVKQFKRPHSDRYLCLKVMTSLCFLEWTISISGSSSSCGEISWVSCLILN